MIKQIHKTACTTGFIVSTVQTRGGAAPQYETAVICPERGVGEPVRSSSRDEATRRHDLACAWAMGRRDPHSAAFSAIERGWE